MSILSHFKESRIGLFWLKYDNKIILVIGMILIAAISFEAGYLQGQKNKSEPVVVNKVAATEAANCDESKNDTFAAESKNIPSNKKTAENENAESPVAEKQSCAFVASKNSNKYHIASCQWAARIKPENRICFSSAEEAQGRGYQGAKCCIK